MMTPLDFENNHDGTVTIYPRATRVEQGTTLDEADLRLLLKEVESA